MSKSFNIPISSIKPANQIIDIINGKSTICIANPYFTLPGMSRVDISTFLSIKQNAKNGVQGTTGQTVASPAIVVNLQHIYPSEYSDPYFTKNVLFTQDNGEKQPTTKLSFYGDFNGSDTQSKKVLGKYTAKRGGFENGDLIHNELIINYQLCQAFEFLYLARMFKIEKFEYSTDTEFLADIASILYTGNKCQRGQAPQIPADVGTKLTNYVNYNCNRLQFPQDIISDPYFVKNLTDYRFMTKFSKNIDTDGSYFDLFNYDIITIFKPKFMTIRPNTNVEYLDNNYLNVLRAMKYSGMKSATSNCAYTLNDAKGQKSGTTVKTDYVLVLIGEGNHTKKLAINPKSGKPEFVNMQLSDINELKGNNYVAKVFLELSFDMRAYPSLASSPFSIRYKINTIAYKKSLGSKGLNVGVSDIDVTGFGEVDADETDVESVQNEIDPPDAVY